MDDEVKKNDSTEEKREGTNYLALGMSLGTMVGLCIGTVSDNLSLGIALGMSIGISFGLILNSKNAKKSEEEPEGNEEN